MRSSFAGLALLAAFLAVAGGASAHLGSVHVDPRPTSGAEDPLCLPSCEIDSARQGFVPGLVVVEEGMPVTWTSADGAGHTVTANPAEDAPGMVADGSSNYYPEACFDVYFQPGSAAEVTFDVRDDGLYALETSASDPSWQACEQATSIGEGWLVSYHCQIHPQLQHAGILVLPG